MRQTYVIGRPCAIEHGPPQFPSPKGMTLPPKGAGTLVGTHWACSAHVSQSLPAESDATMSKPFKGIINVDIRDSVPDWTPFEPPKAPDGAPNVLYIVLDDVGFSAIGCYGGPIETPNIDRIAADWRALHAMAHDGALLADALVPADRAQPHAQQHGVHHRGRDRVPERERHDPAGERDAAGDPRRARLEHLHDRQVASVPDRRDAPGVDRGATGRPGAGSSASTASLARRRTSGIRTWSTTTIRSISPVSRSRAIT